jgi:hypothetical protein
MKKLTLNATSLVCVLATIGAFSAEGMLPPDVTDSAKQKVRPLTNTPLQRKMWGGIDEKVGSILGTRPEMIKAMQENEALRKELESMKEEGKAAEERLKQEERVKYLQVLKEDIGRVDGSCLLSSEFYAKNGELSVFGYVWCNWTKVAELVSGALRGAPWIVTLKLYDEKLISAFLAKDGEYSNVEELTIFNAQSLHLDQIATQFPNLTRIRFPNFDGPADDCPDLSQISKMGSLKDVWLSGVFSAFQADIEKQFERSLARNFLSFL